MLGAAAANSYGPTRPLANGWRPSARFNTINIVIFKFTTENIVIDFMPNLHIPLLGVKSFLSNFTLKIDLPQEKHYDNLKLYNHLLTSVINIQYGEYQKMGGKHDCLLWNELHQMRMLSGNKGKR